MTTSNTISTSRSRHTRVDSHLPKMSSEKRHSGHGCSARRGQGDAKVALEMLLPSLRAAASYLCWKSNGELEADDLAQSMAVTLLEKGFDEAYGAGYYLKLASWRARDYCDAARAYRSYVASMPTVVDRDGETVDIAELMPAPDASPEDHAIAAERLAELRARLTPTQAKIVAMLMEGYSKCEIAEQLGVSQARVSQHMAGLRAALAGF